MKKLLPILIGLSLSGFSSLSRAENLMQVYQQARLSNPELRKSAADRDAAFEKINEARSPLLPQLGLGADYTYSNGYRDANGINSNATSASLQLTQSIFDMSKWRALTLQEKSSRDSGRHVSDRSANLDPQHRDRLFQRVECY